VLRYPLGSCTATTAAGLGLNIFNRLANCLYMCNIAQIVNVLQSLLLTEGPESEKCVRTTTYYAFLLFKPHRSNTAIRVEGAGATPAEISASASKNDKEVVLSFVNPHPDSDYRVDCALRGLSLKSGDAEILHDTDINAYNSFEKPDTVVPQKHAVKIDGDRIGVDVPRLSVVTARVALG